jgi:hypothetical protein
MASADPQVRIEMLERALHCLGGHPKAAIEGHLKSGQRGV